MRLIIGGLSVAFTIACAPLIITPALAQESGQSVDKNGSCPKGFKQSGSRCTSSRNVAIVKLGSCPTGFKASGKYCVGDKGDYAEVRSGSCPSGLKASGKYCIK